MRTPTEGNLLRLLTRLLIEALSALARAGQADAACAYAARGWSLLRVDHPMEAERLNAALHGLVRHLSPERVSQTGT